MADPDDRPGDDVDDTSPITIEPVDAAAIDALVDLWIDLAAGQRAHGSHILPEPNRESVRDTLARHAVVDEVRSSLPPLRL